MKAWRRIKVWAQCRRRFSFLPGRADKIYDERGFSRLPGWPTRVYKVVRWESWQTVKTSAVVIGIARVCYSDDYWTRAPRWLAKKGYHLTCFKKYPDACEFAAHHSEIWEAEAKGLFTDLPPRAIVAEVRQGLLDTFGNGLTWPIGTMMAHEIRLVKKLRRVRS